MDIPLDVVLLSVYQLVYNPELFIGYSIRCSFALCIPIKFITKSYSLDIPLEVVWLSIELMKKCLKPPGILRACDNVRATISRLTQLFPVYLLWTVILIMEWTVSCSSSSLISQSWWCAYDWLIWQDPYIIINSRKWIHYIHTCMTVDDLILNCVR